MPVREGSSQPEFSIDVAEADGRVRVAVSGEVDLFTSPRLQAEATKQLERSPVLLDLTGVEFLDSSGIRVIDGLMRLSAESGNELRVAPTLPAGVEQVLRLTGLLEVLPMDDA